MAKIVIMEDDDVQGSLFARALEPDGYEIHAARNATEAIALVEEHGVDLVITDIFVRDKTGLKPDGGILLIGKLRNARFGTNPRIDRKTGNVPIIAITGASPSAPIRNDPLESARDVGADIVMRKPIDLEELRSMVRNLLSRL